MKPFIDHYTVLGLDPSATDDEIKSAYRRAIHESHPDRHDNAAHVEERARKLNEAKRVLLDPASRRAFDLERSVREAARRTATSQAPWRRADPPRPPASRPPAASRAQHEAAKQVTGVVPPPASSRSSGGLWAMLGLGLIAAGGLAMAANSYDPQAERYRGRDGRFRKGRFS